MPSFRRHFESEVLSGTGFDPLFFVSVVQDVVRNHQRSEGVGIILSASYSSKAAKELCCEHIPWVVGWKSKANSSAATMFSSEMIRLLSANMDDVSQAFRQAERSLLSLHQVSQVDLDDAEALRELESS